MGVITRQSTQHSNMFSESEEDLSDYGGNKSPDSTSNILTKRRRLMSEERSRSSTPVFSPQANSPQREPSSDRDSENENKHGISKQNQSFYRSRSASISQSRSRSRRKKDIDVINDNDDAIAKMIADMRIAAKEDRDLNDMGNPAIKKMGMFKRMMQNICKVELRLAFIEANLLSVMTDWLAPMPDKSLPHVIIRSEFLRMLR